MKELTVRKFLWLQLCLSCTLKLRLRVILSDVEWQQDFQRHGASTRGPCATASKIYVVVSLWHGESTAESPGVQPPFSRVIFHVRFVCLTYSLFASVFATRCYASAAYSVVCCQSVCRDVKASRPNWPRGQNFGLGLVTPGLSLGTLWPRPQAFGVGLELKYLILRNLVSLAFGIPSEPPSKKETHSIVWSYIVQHHRIRMPLTNHRNNSPDISYSSTLTVLTQQLNPLHSPNSILTSHYCNLYFSVCSVCQPVDRESLLSEWTYHVTHSSFPISNVMAIFWRTSNAGGVGKNCDSRRIYGYRIDDWFNANNNCGGDRAIVVINKIHWCVARGQCGRHASVNLVYHNQHGRPRWREEKNCTQQEIWSGTCARRIVLPSGPN